MTIIKYFAPSFLFFHIKIFLRNFDEVCEYKWAILVNIEFYRHVACTGKPGKDARCIQQIDKMAPWMILGLL